MTRIALVGSPNCGKSTLFNSITGSHQQTGNWPGVTVDKTSGWFLHEDSKYELIDLPGSHNLNAKGAQGIDEQIVAAYVREKIADVIVNVVDATTLSKGLFLTTQLLELDQPVIVALTKKDIAKRRNIHIDVERLNSVLGCPVVLVDGRKPKSLVQLLEAVCNPTEHTARPFADTETRYQFVDETVALVVDSSNQLLSISQKIDRFILNRVLAIPIFFLVMYLLFFFSINVGSVFIDFFNIVGGALFVDGPSTLLASIGCPEFINAILTDGMGGGMQLVVTFIPVITALFLFLNLLKLSGYMSRAAFVLDRPMQAMGLPGNALIPLMIGFGCNVPSVMATRSLNHEQDRILTIIMSPFMSCGARLTVYVLFVAAFFPNNGHNIVFALYMIGILIAVCSAWLVRNRLFTPSTSIYAQELPAYHLPSLKGVARATTHSLKGFILRAGTTIVLVAFVLNMVSSIGVDGSFGNSDKDQSLLAEIGRTMTPAFHPMGIDNENWPATVGIFTGFFAKEVVVGTLDALYSPREEVVEDFDFLSTLNEAVLTIPTNLVTLGEAALNPIGLAIEKTESIDEIAASNAVELSTVQAMQSLFHGQIGAFSYLLFLLIYVPCIATIGVISKEIGKFWAGFSVIWSITIAYGAAVTCYQLGQLTTEPLKALMTLGITNCSVVILFILLMKWGRFTVKRKQPNMIDVVSVS